MKESIIFIDHILENILDIESFIKDVSKEYFLSNKEKQNAVIRSLEIIGGAVKNISQKVKTKYKEVPWKGIAGTRDKITHHYFGVDLELIWKMVKEDLPNLKKQISEIKADLEKKKDIPAR